MSEERERERCAPLFWEWWQSVPTETHQALAEAAGTSRPYLRHTTAFEGSSYARTITAEMAGRLEQAMLTLDLPQGVEPLSRDQLSSTCAACPLAKKARSCE